MFNFSIHTIYFDKILILFVNFSHLQIRNEVAETILTTISKFLTA